MNTYLKVLTFLIIFITLFSGPSCTRNEIPITPISESDTSDFEIDSTLYEIEKYKIYDKVIEQYFYVYGRDVVIVDSTASDDFIYNNPSLLPDLKPSVPQLKSETAAKYIQFNRKRHKQLSNFSDSLNVQLISHNDFLDILSNGGWNNYYSIYPNSGGLINFTNPGFDRHFSQSIVYLGHEVNYLAGSGTFIFLEKEDGEWLIKYNRTIWVS